MGREICDFTEFLKPGQDHIFTLKILPPGNNNNNRADDWDDYKYEI